MLRGFISFNQSRLADISLYIICIMLGGKACHSMASFSMAYKTLWYFKNRLEK